MNACAGRVSLQRWCAFVVLAALAFAGSPAVADSGEEARLNELALDHLVAGQERVMGVFDRIRVGGAPWCGRKVGPVIGVFAPDEFTLKDFYREVDFVEPFIDAAHSRFQLERKPRVVVMVPGGPAETAGMKVGDRVLSVAGKTTKKRIFLDVLTRKGDGGRVEIEVEREGRPRTLQVEAEDGCAYASRFMPGTEINAFAMHWGSLTGMYLLGGMLDFVASDDELAVIAGHELAHLILAHTRTTWKNEAAADHLGLYIAANAGFDVSVAPGFWERMAEKTPYSFVDRGFYRHPLGARRALSLELVLQEIAAKQARGLPLAPAPGEDFSVPQPEVDDRVLEARREEIRAAALAKLRSDQTRIQQASYRLALAGQPECADELGPVLGATVARRMDFGRHKGEELEAAFGVDDHVRVLAVAEGSPADRAGLRLRDRIVRVDGERISRSSRVFRYLRAAESDPIPIEIDRDGTSHTLSLPRETGCPYGTLVMPIGGATTGHKKNRTEVAVPTGVLAFVKDDDELAFVVAHQLAHHVLETFREADEEPAVDAMAIAIAARAGYDVRKAPAFWDRWAIEQFWTISPDMDGENIPHGGMARRAPAIRAAVAASAGPPHPIATGP